MPPRDLLAEAGAKEEEREVRKHLQKIKGDEVLKGKGENSSQVTNHSLVLSNVLI